MPGQPEEDAERAVLGSGGSRRYTGTSCPTLTGIHTWVRRHTLLLNPHFVFIAHVSSHFVFIAHFSSHYLFVFILHLFLFHTLFDYLFILFFYCILFFFFFLLDFIQPLGCFFFFFIH